MTTPPPDAASAGPGQEPVAAGAGLAGAAAQLEAIAPGYLETVRAAAAALGVGGARRAGVAAAAGVVRDTSALDLEVPTASATLPGTYLKVAVKRLTTWYLRYLTVQVATFAGAVAAMGEAIVARLDDLDATDAELTGRVAELDRRVAEVAGRLERIEADAAGPRTSPR